MQIQTPTVLQGGGGGGGWSPTWVLDMLHYLKTILPSVESLWSSLQDDEVYFMGGGTAGGLCMMSPTMVAILVAILEFTKN